MESRPSLHLSEVAIDKGAFGSPSTKVANFTYFYLSGVLKRITAGIEHFVKQRDRQMVVCIRHWQTLMLDGNKINNDRKV